MWLRGTHAPAPLFRRQTSWHCTGHVRCFRYTPVSATEALVLLVQTCGTVYMDIGTRDRTLPTNSLREYGKHF